MDFATADRLTAIPQFLQSCRGSALGEPEFDARLGASVSTAETVLTIAVRLRDEPATSVLQRLLRAMVLDDAAWRPKRGLE